jgi:hypothetical protein
VTTPLDAALKYASIGWHVFPLCPDTKIPRKGSRGYLDATTDRDQICRWWGRHPGDDVAVACRPSGFIAIDVDVADIGKDGLAELAELERIWGPLPRDCVQRSGRGGLHILFRDPSPGADGWTRVAGEIVGKLTPSIDVKCNGYIRVEPSGDYSWLALTPTPPPVPEQWIGLLRKADERGPGDGVEAWSETVRALDDDQKRELAEYLVTLRRGQGTAATFRAIKAIFHDWGLSADDGWPFLIGWNARCGVPHGESELRRQLHRVADRELDGDRGWVFDRADDAAAVDALIAEREHAEAPTPTQIRARLESLAEFSGSNGERKLKKKYARIVLKPKTTEDIDDAELQAACALVRSECPGVTDDQLVALLLPAASTAERAARVVEDTPRPDGPSKRANALAAGLDIDDNGKPVLSQENIVKAIEHLGVDLSHDQFADRCYLERAGERAEFSDAVIDSVWLEVDRTYGFRPSKDLFYTVATDRARANGYHPVLEYLAGLEWDGVARLDSWLVDYCGAEDTEYVRAVGALPMIAAVRRVRSPGAKFDELLILESEVQGTGKSSAVKTLAVRDHWFSDDLPLGAPGKVVVEQTAGFWLIEVGELQRAKGRDREDIKAFLSRTADVGRAAYARLAARRARSFVAIGTSNGAVFDDATGNRRFWPVTVDRIDLDGLRTARDQIWAEAAAREADGASIRLAEELWPAAAEAQLQRTSAEDPIADKIEAWLGDLEGWVDSEDLWRVLELEDVDRRGRLTHKRWAALKRLGFVRIQHRRRWGYARGALRQTLRPVPKGSGFDVEITDRRG